MYMNVVVPLKSNLSDAFMLMYFIPAYKLKVEYASLKRKYSAQSCYRKYLQRQLIGVRPVNILSMVDF